MSFQPDQLELLLWTGRTSRRKIILHQIELLTVSGLAAVTFSGWAEQVLRNQTACLQFGLNCLS